MTQSELLETKKAPSVEKRRRPRPLKNEEGPVREDEALIVRSEADGTRTRNHRRDKPEL